MNTVEEQLIINNAKENQDKYVVRILVNKYNMSISEAVRTWYLSKTRKRIQTSNVFDIRIAYPTKCLCELEKELDNDPFWFKTSW